MVCTCETDPSSTVCHENCKCVSENPFLSCAAQSRQCLMTVGVMGEKSMVGLCWSQTVGKGNAQGEQCVM